ncbi:uncharacterized protein PITG_15065 [Phytophthora infestans T30-4]|uniref:Uncharacterized protein n=1 Tax=Phytophthora infestans (strain T30-4) TaxID=403677 RepID=D0NRK4_PHYIT|nr:uncharacterized protein PITG_15065 [Phytophthora infestans T30-4]EEY63354.1 conserved hypothetical protein [Phytophthora infestans T30-4]|eukprot:XP_002898239.1 conserved hypothetical protein [Phytophthora infestans T30-4]
MPWDRKVPKTRLCGPCCWKKFRRPFEPFYTWWRHENYFTWVFCPYRNERLSRGERALIVVQYSKNSGGDLTGFSFRLAFLLQVLVVLLLTLAQAPIFYIWAKRSCLFLTKFIYYGTWGWKDLCPLCTERIVHCDCFNDELLVLAVERVGPKWELIRVLDGLMAKQNNFNPHVIVERAEKHMEKVERLGAYQEKKKQETLRRGRIRHNFSILLSRRGSTNQPRSSDVENTEDSSAETWDESYESNIQLCITREKKILELNSRIKLDTFEKHYDSNISDVFHALTRSVMKHRQTMWVFDTPEQRLQRREEEKLQRKRIVRVLND